MKLFFVFDNYNEYRSYRKLTEQEAAEYGQDGCLVEVTRITTTETGAGVAYGWCIECTQFYGRDAICRLEITQPLDRALMTFGAMLAADSEFEQKYGTFAGPHGPCWPILDPKMEAELIADGMVGSDIVPLGGGW